MKKVVVHYPFIPHYRNPIFNLLNSSKKFSFKFIADTCTNFNGILQSKQTMNFSPLNSKYIVVKIPFLKRNVELEFDVLRHLFREKGDIYICLGNPNIITSWFYSLIAKLLGYKVYYWTQGLKKKEVGIKGFIRRIYLKIPDGLLLYGERADKILRTDGINNNKVIYNSLDYSVQKECRERINKEEIMEFKERLNINKEDIVLICIGRLLPKLKIDQAIEATILLNKRLDVSVHLLVVGSGPDEGRLKSISDEWMENIHFLGPIYSEKELSLIYSSSSLSIVCGVVGLSAMHSLAYGIPMVTHDNNACHCPEVEAIVDGETGFIYKENDINDVLNAINRYRAADKLDLYENCISVIENKYNPVTQASLIEDALSNV